MKNRTHKYNAKKTVVDNITFDSAKEAKRYSELKLLEKAGEIIDLKLQPKFPLMVARKKIGEYWADFQYKTMYGDVIIEDTKGYRTDIYKLKKKIVEAIYGITITEI